MDIDFCRMAMHAFFISNYRVMGLRDYWVKSIKDDEG